MGAPACNTAAGETPGAEGLSGLVRAFFYAAGPLTIGQIAVGCALGWFDFRYGHVHWRQARPKLAAFIEGVHARPSFKATVPVG